MTVEVETGGLTRAEAASLLAWWVEAGVDVAIQEEGRDWRKAAPRPAPVAAEPVSTAGETVAQPPSAPKPASERPQTLDAFHAWLASSADLPLFRAGAARALPHGPAEAEIMLLTGIPQPDDIAEGKPIGGEAWTLAVRMLAAIGIAPDTAYVAALTCFSAGGTRFTPAETEACRDNILAQIGLARPKRLLLLGDAPAKLLLGQSVALARGRLHQIGGVPAVATYAPHHLLKRSEDKKLAWADLLLLMGNDR